MRPNSLLLLGALTSGAQTVIGSLALLLAYSILIFHHGSFDLGEWSLFVGVMSILRIGEVGLQAAMIQKGGAAISEKKHGKHNDIVSCATSYTVSLHLGMFAIGTIILALFASETKYYEVAVGALLYCTTSAITIIFLCVFTTCNLMWVRNIMLLFGHLVFIACASYYIPRFGQWGFTIAALWQCALVLLVSAFASRLLRFRPYKFRIKIHTLNHLLRYGTAFQLSTVAQACYDPLTKGALAHWGDFSMVSLFEVANKIVLSLRQILVSAYEALVPFYASSVKARDVFEGRTPSILTSSTDLLVVLTCISFSLLMPMGELALLLYTDLPPESFRFFYVPLVLSWFVNTLSTSYYYAGVGIARQSTNMISHITIGVLNLILAPIMGHYFGGRGVLVGWCVSLVFGSVYTLWAFPRSIGLSGKQFLVKLTGISIAALSIFVLHFTAYCFVSGLHDSATAVYFIHGVFCCALMIMAALLAFNMLTRQSHHDSPNLSK